MDRETLLDVIVDMQKEYVLRKYETIEAPDSMSVLGEFQRDLLMCIENDDMTSGLMMFGSKYEDYIAMID